MNTLTIILLLWDGAITMALLYLLHRPPIVNTGEVINNHPVTEKTIHTDKFMVTTDDMEKLLRYIIDNKGEISEPIAESLKVDYFFMQELSMNLNNLQVHR